MAARKKSTDQQIDLFSRRYIIKSGPWYRANWAQLRATLPQDERDRLDPGNGSWIFWTSCREHAEWLTQPPPGWTWDRLTPVD